MSAPIEVLITSDVSGQLWNACVWDLTTGASLTSYKGESSAPRGLSVLAGQYLLGASCNKPLIHEQHQLKMVCGGKVTSMTICTGNLLCVLSRHYQTVNVIRFTDNGSHFVSGGEDNLVLVWSLVSVLSNIHNPSLKAEPKNIWSSHSLPITDIHVGRGGARSRVVSASLDQTCKPIRVERHIETQEEEGVSCYRGHSKQVTCLSLTMDGTKLVSGSNDCTVKVWDVFSGQCISNLPHKGPISNVLVIPTPAAILDPASRPTMTLQPFKRHLATSNQGERGEGSNVMWLRIHGNRSEEEETELDMEDIKHTEKGDATSVMEELQAVKDINKQLYTFAVNKILANKIT
ncbi:WDR18-like protein [Mya arenaria]|uniref:WDR18-like protein n=1 Tax=Mya arenaria TaxID=6604 RepID=A0ABY7FRZ3_MYAAR|nr:WDR18-like protein [Mya arenaria]